MPGRANSLPVRGLAVTAAILAIAAFVVGYASRALFNPDQFADRAAAALENEAVAGEVGVRIADGLIERKPNLIAAKPLLESATESIVRGSVFQGVFRAGVADLHRGFFERDQNTVVLTVVDIGTTVGGALQALDPKLAARVPGAGGAVLVEEDIPSAAATALQAANVAEWLPWLLGGLAIAFTVGALAMARDRRATARSIGVSILVASVVVLVALALAKALVLAGIDEAANRDAADAIWDAFLGDLRTGLLLAAGFGAVLAAAASSLFRPVDMRAHVEAFWRAASRTPESGFARVARALLLLALGVLAITHVQVFISGLGLLLGVAIAYLGVAELLRMISADHTAQEPQRARPVVAAAIVTGAAALAAVGVFVGTGGITQGSLKVETVGCNGSLDLCDRPYDEVATPATHNSMSAATYPGWNFAQQEEGIAEQLRAGIRGLLIDAYPGTETQGGTIKTDMSNISAGKREAIEAAMGERALDAALRIRDRIVGSAKGGTRGVYLCHGFCEVGAIPIDLGFTEIRDFVEANPDEVVTVVIEDYVPPGDIAAAAERTGLIDFVYEGPVGEPWPTLQQMIDSGGRVLMMAENEADTSEVPWYHPAYESLVQETPYSFGRPAELTDPALLEASCAPNRGSPDAAVFLVNHWIDTSPAPRPTNAAKVNKRSALLDRIHQCEEQRDLTATLIAIDFFKEGDLFGAAAALNAER